MGRIAYTHNEYLVIESKRGHTIINMNGTFSDNHGHVKKLGTAKLLIGLIKKEIVPDSSYLRETAKRISLNSRYIEKINIKINNDKNKQQYFNPNKGLKR